MPRITIVPLLGVVAIGFAGWHCLGPERPPAGVVLITLDTTRADRLSPYGLVDASMPALDRLAREGMVFDQAVSVAPLTLPAHTSLFTGVFPPGHGVRDNTDVPLPDRYVTLAELLREQGYRTGAFVGSVVLDPDRGLAQGFDTYTGVGPGDGPAGRRWQRRADAVLTDALSWLAEIGDSRFFLWTHFYDPHGPYDPPEPFRSRHGDPYIGEIAYVDAQIGRLLDWLEGRGRLDRTIVIVAADHGESLTEHGERTHGVFVYESVLRVPLMIRAPRFAPGRSTSLVRLVDVMPTILELTGITAPRVDGVSLTPLMSRTAGDLGLEAYAESLYPLRFGWSALRALREGRFKVIDAPRPELYDLAVDPFETTSIYEGRRLLGEAMIRRLRSYAVDRQKPHASGEGPAAVAPDLIARLSALGYVGTPRRPEANGHGRLPDPKDCLREYPPHVSTVDLETCLAQRLSASHP